MSLQRNPRLTMYPTMYLSKKSCIMLCIDLGRTTERPLKKEDYKKIYENYLTKQT